MQDTVPIFLKKARKARRVERKMVEVAERKMKRRGERRGERREKEGLVENC